MPEFEKLAVIKPSATDQQIRLYWALKTAISIAEDKIKSMEVSLSGLVPIEGLSAIAQVG